MNGDHSTTVLPIIRCEDNVVVSKVIFFLICPKLIASMDKPTIKSKPELIAERKKNRKRNIKRWLLSLPIFHLLLGLIVAGAIGGEAFFDWLTFFVFADDLRPGLGVQGLLALAFDLIIPLIGLFFVAALTPEKYAARAQKRFEKRLAQWEEQEAQAKAEKAEKKKVELAAAEKEKKFEDGLKEHFTGLDELELEIESLSKMEGVEVHDFKDFIQDLESEIIDKGEDKTLFEFLKVASFLKDSVDVFEQKWSSLANEVNFFDIKRTLRLAKEREAKGGMDVVLERLEMTTEALDGKRDYTRAGTKTEAAVEKLLDLRGEFVLDYEKDVKTILFYKAMAYSMCTFFMEDKKIMYFEIHEAFEKIGAFDSTWQKNTSSQLKGISDKLDLIGAGLLALHESFTQLNEKQDNIIKGIESVQGAVSGVAALSAIQVYQNYKLSKNIKELGK
jgi:hypothetical protein